VSVLPERDVFEELFKEIVYEAPSPIILIGFGGSGKSTFARWMARRLLRELGQHGLMPVVVDLKGLREAAFPVAGWGPIGLEELEASRLDMARVAFRSEDLLIWLLNNATVGQTGPPRPGNALEL